MTGFFDRRRWLARVTSPIASIVAFALLLGSSVASSGCSKKDEPASPSAAPALTPPPPPPPPPPSPPPPAHPAPPAPAAIVAVTLGPGILPDKRVTTSREVFGPKDTIYASVGMMGVGRTTIRGVWMFEGHAGKSVPVEEDSLTVDLDGPATHELHISKKTPWPKGSYQVEVFLGDTSAAKKSFVVK